MNMHPDIARRRPAPPEFENSLARHESSLRNLASSLCRSHDKAERLVQVVLAKARAEHGSFDRTGNLASWLMKRMRNEFNATLTASTAVDLTTDTKAKPVQSAKAAAALVSPVVDKVTTKAKAKAKAVEASGDFRVIDIRPFLNKLQTPKSEDLGVPPELAWIDIELLRVDVKYQREILRSGRKNVIEIAAHFDWSRFATVIVARIHDGLYAIVDGQHRTTAAACRGVTKVPCQIIQATPEQQAAAFAAINGNVTKMTPLQLHAARVAAGDRKARELDRVCAEAGVEILRYPVPANNIKAGQTLAVSCLSDALKTFGAETLGAALSCLTQTGGGNVGLLRRPVIRGLCQVLSQRPKLVANLSSAIRKAEEIDFDTLLEDASVEARRTRRQVASVIIEKLAEPFGPPANLRKAA
ncbi:hypothetical protein ACVIGB_000884 [Bradyrhizobium sp. USDA 4341]